MLHAFEYSIVRVVPRVEREEFVNVGAIVFCHDSDYLEARVELDEARLLALFPAADVPLFKEHLDAVVRICRGGDEAGPIGSLPARERWYWLTSPKNTIVQTSPPHAGLTEAPSSVLEHLLATTVRIARTA